MLWVLRLASATAALHAETDIFGLLWRASFPPVSARAEPIQPLRVIGAGLEHALGSELEEALVLLGFRPYTLRNVFESGHIRGWSTLAHARELDNATMREHARTHLFDTLAGAGFNATVGLPASLMLEDALGRYPDARVILTIPDSAESWARDVTATTLRIAPVLKRRPWQLARELFFLWRVLDPFMWSTLGAPRGPALTPPELGALATAHERWVEHVQTAVPSAQLLVHRPADGLGPLCAFLGLSAEDAPACVDGVPYPGRHTHAELERILDRAEPLAICVDLFLASLTAVLICLGLCCAHKYAPTPEPARPNPRSRHLKEH